MLGKVLPKPLAVLGAVGGNAVVQTGQEVGQSLPLPTAEEIAAALDKDIKGPKWREVMKAELEALGPNAGVSLIYSIVAAAGAPVARHTNRAELKRALQDRHGLELAGFDAGAVDAVVKAAASDPEKAADLLHASWQETSVEKRRANSARKLEAMQALGEQGKPGAEKQVADGDPAGVPAVPEAGDGEGAGKRTSFFEPDEELVNRAVDEAVARGNLANTDEVRSLIPGYNEADPLTRDSEFHRQASALNDRVIARLLEREPVTRSAILLAGGAGSGKSSILKRLEIPRDLVIDTTLSWEDNARQIAADIEASGRTPIVLYVHRPFGKAFEDGVIERYLEGKKEGAPRLVPLRVAAEAHVGAQETVIALAAEGAKVSVYDNSGGAGQFFKSDIEFLKQNRYTTANEARRESGTGTREETDARRVGGPTVGGDGESPGGHQAGLRGEDAVEGGDGGGARRKQRAIDRLIAEGNAILERYRREGKLTDAEVRAFRGEGGGPEGSPGNGDGSPPEGGGDAPGSSNRPAAPTPSSEGGRTESSESQPEIRELTSLPGGESVYALELPDGTRSEHATRDGAQDSLDTWTAEREYEDWVGQAHSGQKGGERDPERMARDYAEGDRIVARLMPKSTTARGKGKVRKALLGELTAMTAEEIHILRSPVEIMLRYSPDGKFHSARRGEHHTHDGPANVIDGETFCHNHPGGKGPGNTDLRLALRNPTCTVRVVARGKHGRRVYRIRAKRAADPKMIEEITESYKRACRRRGDHAAARDEALRLILDQYGDFISVERTAL